jgi:hypothetical protein
MTTQWHCPEFLTLYTEALERTSEEKGESAADVELLIDFRRVGSDPL